MCDHQLDGHGAIGDWSVDTYTYLLMSDPEYGDVHCVALGRMLGKVDGFGSKVNIAEC